MKPSDLRAFFEESRISQDCLDGKEILIASIGDLLQVCEDCKKENYNKDMHWLEKRFAEEMENPQSPLNRGTMHISDLDQETLNRALFEREDNIVKDLWSKAANSHISPTLSVRYLTIRVTDETVWWPEDVFLQMEQCSIDQD